MMKLLLLLYFILISSFVNSQSASNSEFNEKDQRGFFSVENFRQEDYQAHHQNWFITQDRNGFIYAANGNGILEFDGVTWRLISSPGLHAVRVVVADHQNIKWIGADRDLGYLEPDSLGFLRFKSLKHKIPASHPLTGNVWQIFPDGDRIVFASENTIYSWTGNEFQIIHDGPEMQRRFQVNGKMYFAFFESGMYQLDGDRLQLIPDGKKLQHMRIYAAVPYGNNAVLFASREAGIFHFDGAAVTKFPNEVDEYLIRNNVYAGILLSDSSYAFATLRAGVIMMDKNGNRIREITGEDGILNNQVYGIAQDNRNAIWLALQTGISQVEPHSPYTFFNKRSGIEGTVSTITRHNGKLHIGTYDGLFTQQQLSEKSPSRFQRVDGIQNGCFSMLSLGNDLLLGSADGVYLLSGGKVVEVKKFAACRALFQSKSDPNRVFVGHRGGLSTLYFKDGTWQHEKDFVEIDEEIRSILANDQGDLWLGTTLHSILKIEFPPSNDSSKAPGWNDIKIYHYDDRHGLPKEINTVFLVDGQLLVRTYGKNGPLYYFDANDDQFKKYTRFGDKFGLDSMVIYPISYQKNGDHILLASVPNKGTSYRFSASRKGESDAYKIRRILDDKFRSTTENEAYWDDEDILWLGGEQVTRYDLKTSIVIDPEFKTHIRKVTIGEDSAIYGGMKSAIEIPEIEFSNKELRFEFAAPGFVGKGTNKYQYQLIGFDNKWSAWNKETRKDYTNLAEGEYEFVVRAQNIYGELYTGDTFQFVILPPWYRTWWAYAFYILLISGFLYVVVQWRASKLKSEKKALGIMVAERTSEIRSQANQLKIQAEKLKQLDRVKSRFFANISHEFRTPLTLISGCLDDLKKESDVSKSKDRLSIMQKNTTRLRQLIEQLLDLSKLENGKVNLTVSPVNPGFFLSAITSSFSSWATQKQIALTLDIPKHDAIAYLDEDILEKILTNLLSNAIKFTPRNGFVTLAARWNDDELTIHVSDSGPGIPESKIDQIFERFYQVDDSNTRSQEGSGIGLALVKELIAIHRGKISVVSDLASGSTFNVVVPINRKFYLDSEILSDQSFEPIKEKEVSVAEENYVQKDTFPDDSSIVLIVEDNIDLGRYIGDHLPDWKTVLAGNGAEGLQKAIQYVPDLIISDVMMPEMDGIELCKKIKDYETTSHIPVILLTAKADVESRLEGLETGADDYITKPFNARELQTRVKNLIHQRKSLRDRFSRTVVLKPKDIAITSADESFLKKIMSAVEDHLSDSDFSVQHFQKELGMSRMQLHRKLKALTGHSASDFIRIQRLIRASEMLVKTDNNISEVCYQTGFTSLSYFAKCFKKQFGTTPKEYASHHSPLH